MQHGMKHLVESALPEMWKLTVEQEAAHLRREHGDVFAQNNSKSLLNMQFSDKDKKTGDDYENENAEFECVE